MTTLAPIHPGEVLIEDFIEPLGVTQHSVAIALGVIRTPGALASTTYAPSPAPGCGATPPNPGWSATSSPGRRGRSGASTSTCSARPTTRSPATAA